MRHDLSDATCADDENVLFHLTHQTSLGLPLFICALGRHGCAHMGGHRPYDRAAEKSA
jgi:hypothetical protein